MRGTLTLPDLSLIHIFSLTVHKGEFHGIIGLNGSGKSTLLKVISGVFKPTAGTVVVHGSIAPLIKKVYIPKYIFQLERVCFALVNCLFSFIALVIVMLVTGATLHATVLLAFYPLLTLVVFTPVSYTHLIRGFLECTKQ